LLFKKLSVTLIVLISIFISYSNVYAANVILGGDSIGIDIKYDGVIITGTYDIIINNQSYNPENDGYQYGDLITQVNNQKIDSISTLMAKIEKQISISNQITLTLKRNQKILKKTLLIQNYNNQFSTGLYVVDGLSGIGTMTYYNPSNHHFAALGHKISDESLDINIEDIKGQIYKSNVTSIVKSQINKPGEKIADISDIKIGNIYENNEFGIYGNYDESKITSHNLIETAEISEVKLGKAYFYTVLNNNTIKKYEINITSLKKQSKKDIKGISFEVIDKEVLNKSNGIVQGMSGSPIVQNGKLIGCITHVDMNDPTKGYGLYIKWMLENDK
jgi:stage IV sporulation protein B